MSKLKEFTDIDLQEELARREKIKNGAWPRKYTLGSYIELENEDFACFLEEECGFVSESPEFDQATNVLAGVPLDIEVGKNGATRVVGIDGRAVVEPDAVTPDPDKSTSFEVSPSKKLEYWEPSCGLPIPVTEESVKKGHDLGLNDGCYCPKSNKE